ncbi:MAG: ATP-binding protein, partial [Solirubrobacteraceae bacterium]
QGPLEVEVRLDQSLLTVLVRDRGYGVEEQPDGPDATALGIGLHVIQTLTSHVEFKDTRGGGTEVRMEFAPSCVCTLEQRSEDNLRLPSLALAEPSVAATVSIAPISLARTVLPRLVSALAARAHFSTDRISDAQLLADALVAHAHGVMSGDHLSIGVSVEPRSLELHIAPLDVGCARRLISDSELQGLGKVIEKLTDRSGVRTATTYETLTLSLNDRPSARNT